MKEREERGKKYKVIDSKETVLGRFCVHIDTIEKNNNKYPYPFIETKNSVGVLAFCNIKIILIYQYRHAFGTYEYEIPGGAIELNELPKDVAIRELLEETDYYANTIEEIGTYYPSPGILREVCYLFVANCTKTKNAEREPLEYIRNVVVDIPTFIKMIENGVFKHSMGLVAWLKYCLKVGSYGTN